MIKDGVLARFIFKEEFGPDFCDHGGTVLEQIYPDVTEVIETIKQLEAFVEDVVVQVEDEVFSLLEVTQIIKEYRMHKEAQRMQDTYRHYQQGED